MMSTPIRSDSRVGVLLRSTAGAAHLIAEDIIYEPDGGRIADEIRWGLKEEGHYKTTGTQLFIDLRRRSVVEQGFEAHEGSIQGLVYAVDAICFGGPLTADEYRCYIDRLLEEATAPGSHDFREPLRISRIHDIETWLGAVSLAETWQRL